MFYAKFTLDVRFLVHVIHSVHKCVSIELQLFPLEGVDLKFLWSIALLSFIQFIENNVILCSCNKLLKACFLAQALWSMAAIGVTTG